MNIFGRKESNEGGHLIYNLIILDESGSMNSIRSATLEGMSSVFTTIREGMEQFPDQNHSVSLVSFSEKSNPSHNFRRILWNEPVHNIPAAFSGQYKPEGGTPLYDAIGYSINALKQELQGLSPDAYNVLVTILTDGAENASTAYSYDQVKKMIESCSEGPWTFAFIGAGLEAYNVAQDLSIKNAMAFTPDNEGISSLFQKTREANLYYMASINEPAKRGKGILDFFSGNKKDKEDEENHRI